MADVNITTHFDTFHLRIDFQVKTGKTPGITWGV
jgi:hypothetical protein